MNSSRPGPEILDEQIELVHATLADAAQQGTIPAPAATRDTARALLAQLEGMVMFAKLANDPSVPNGLWRQTSRLLLSQAVGRQGRVAGASPDVAGIRTDLPWWHRRIRS